ncbi:hypothetical protein [Reinekea sp.]|uniref:hypothetical protein n=1 Tax=Reinekea sp. TaxID=1970455 RepID=UPI002A814302|nr:hypothetical protein [Reinekea sp.]
MRSYWYLVSLLLIGCAQLRIALLGKAWPLEVYDALCSADDYPQVKWEWGRCALYR